MRQMRSVTGAAVWFRLLKSVDRCDTIDFVKIAQQVTGGWQEPAEIWTVPSMTH